jgi:hypothetical protein
MWTALGRQRLFVLSQHPRVPSHSLCFLQELLVGVGGGSGQLRPYPASHEGILVKLFHGVILAA